MFRYSSKTVLGTPIKRYYTYEFFLYFTLFSPFLTGPVLSQGTVLNN